MNEQDKKIRERNWFITINPKAECYSKIEEIIKSFKYKHYAYIYHAADEDNVNDKHIHLVIEFINARTFEAVQSKFYGANIERAKFKFQCYKYLIHLESDNKRKYHIEDIKTDSLDYYKECIQSNEYEKLDTKAVMTDITNGINTITEFVNKYGLYQTSRFNSLLGTLIRENQYIERINDLEYKIKELRATIDELQEIIQSQQKNIDENLPF